MVKLRALLNLDEITDFTKGSVRSEVVKEIYSRAVDYEEKFYKYLISMFPEVWVHEQKRMRPGNVASDFFLYTKPNSGIVIDVFYAKNLKSLGGIISIKLKRYSLFTYPTYLVLVENYQIIQEEIDTLMKNRKDLIPLNISVVTEKYFKDNIENITEGLSSRIIT